MKKIKKLIEHIQCALCGRCIEISEDDKAKLKDAKSEITIKVICPSRSCKHEMIATIKNGEIIYIEE